ncbi:histone-lysine N-methyltransferase SETMAR [Elysia marginata]|uniref:Histone-lysine N-methyltransferase SETMAR n=1 Tax=Elysia marginata TaxID=1093978 RepID=A0AAV4FTS6_9GAST|nr:histone-lysine N-methyltransferase SETMAR [Elysia marginata]
MPKPTEAFEQVRRMPRLDGLQLTTLPRPSYSPDLAPSDYHLFGPMKQCWRGKHYENDEEVKSAVKTWLKEQPIDCLQVRGWKSGIHSPCNAIESMNVALERGSDCLCREIEI